MRTLDIVTAVLVIVGGLNWGLVGLFGFDLVATLFGDMSVASRAVYVLVGLAAAARVLTFRALRDRQAGAAPATG